MDIALRGGGFAVIDDEDAELIRPFSWRRHHPKGKVVYAAAQVYEGGRQRIVYMHRMVGKIAEGLQCDHIDGDGLNNRRSNLRACTLAENCCNRGPRSDNTSGFRGVHRQGKGFVGKVTVNGVRHSKYFQSAEVADAWCQAKRAELHGQFAR